MHIYIYIHVRTHTHIHIYTHTHTKCTYECTQSTSETTGAAATAREAQLDAKKFCPSPCPLQSRGGYPSWPEAQLPVHEERLISAEQPQPTAGHHTITTARCPDHIRLSALVRSQSTQYMVHASCQLGHGPPKRGHFPAIFSGFYLYIFFLI